MTVFLNEGKWDSSNVEFSEGKIINYSKTERSPQMTHIDYGLGVFSKEVFEKVSPDLTFDLASLYESLARKDLLAALEVRQRFYEVGSFSGIKELRHYLKQTGEP